jgi:hypothetical protein
MARVGLLEESGHVKSSDSTAVRDSKYSLPILKMVLYISECMKDQPILRFSRTSSKNYCRTAAGDLP